MKSRRRFCYQKTENRIKCIGKVGLYLPKGVEQAACEVALAYLNIVFLPIDVEFPVKIVEHCVSAIGLRMILTDTNPYLRCLTNLIRNVAS